MEGAFWISNANALVLAMAVAAAIDALKFTEVVGCIAGDDTIMCASKSDEDAKKAIEQITKLLTEL